LPALPDSLFSLITDLFLECDQALTLPALPDSAVCILEDTCTGVTCCINVDFLHKTFSAFVELDACNHSLKFGIEKIQEQINLFDYSFGKFCCFCLYIYALKHLFVIHLFLIHG
jgi:hypothetical protein